MKLLLDQNLSKRLVSVLSEHFGTVIHVESLGLGMAEDRVIWQIAQEHDYVIVTKDSDFVGLVLLHGPPPKVIRLQVGNCTWSWPGTVLIEKAMEVQAFINDRDAALLVLPGRR